MSSLCDAEFDAIAAAVRSSECGRLFLVEFARRSRNADTEELLAVMARLERSIATHALDPAMVLEPLPSNTRILSCIDAALVEAEAAIVTATETTAAIFSAAGETRQRQLSDSVQTEIAATIDAIVPVQEIVRMHTRRVFEILLEARSLADGTLEAEPARAEVRLTAAPPTIAAANDSAPKDLLAPFRRMADDERVVS